MTREPNQPTPGRGRRIVEAYGADPARWPADERARPKQDEPGLDDVRAAEARIDALLDTLPAGTASPELVRKVMAAAPNGSAALVREPSPTGRLAAFWPWRTVWRPAAAALAFSAFVGIALGLIVYTPVADTTDETETARELAFDPAGIEEPTAYADTGEIETVWGLAFDPAGIELTSFVMDDM